MRSAVGTSFFSSPLCFFPCSRLSSYRLSLFLCLISFLLFPRAGVWETLVHEFSISYSHTEWYLLFKRGEIVCLGRSFVYQNQIKLNYLHIHFYQLLSLIYFFLYYFVLDVPMRRCCGKHLCMRFTFSIYSHYTERNLLP